MKYYSNQSIVQALLSNDNIDLSRTFEDKTALQYSESHDQINEEGRLACQELFSSLKVAKIVKVIDIKT